MTKQKCRWSPKTTAAINAGIRDPGSDALNVQNNLIFFSTSPRRTFNKSQHRSRRQSEVIAAVRFDSSTRKPKKHKCARRSLYFSSFLLSFERRGKAFLPSTLMITPDTRDQGSVGGAQPHITVHRACVGTSVPLGSTQALVYMCAINASMIITANLFAHVCFRQGT